MFAGIPERAYNGDSRINQKRPTSKLRGSRENKLKKLNSNKQI